MVMTIVTSIQPTVLTTNDKCYFSSFSTNGW